MSCPTGKCGGKKKVIALKNTKEPGVAAHPPEQAMDFSALSVVTSKVRGGNGQYYSIGSPLVKIKPLAGWGIHVRVKGHVHFVVGPTAESTVNAISKFYADNGLPVDPMNVWLGANMAWIKQVAAKHAHTTLRDLEALSRSENERTLRIGSQPYPPQVWGAKGWGFLQVLLASESYTYERFVNAAELLLVLLADERTGCDECLVHFRKALAEFTGEAPAPSEDSEAELEAVVTRDLTYARKWLFDVMNENRVSQGRPGFPWDYAVEVNRWVEAVVVEGKPASAESDGESTTETTGSNTIVAEDAESADTPESSSTDETGSSPDADETQPSLP